jgi:hypothetical protein
MGLWTDILMGNIVVKFYIVTGHQCPLQTCSLGPPPTIFSWLPPRNTEFDDHIFMPLS